MASFPPPKIDRPSVRISSRHGRVDVVAEDRADIDITGDADITRTGSATTVTGERSRLTIRVPVGTDVVIGTTTGRVHVTGAVGAVAITTTAGRIGVEQATTVDARSSNGRIEIEQCSDRCSLRSESGSAAVGSCGPADVATTTGRISLRDVRGEARAHCTNGRIDITMATANDVSAETINGRINVSLPRGVRILRTDLAHRPAETSDSADCIVSTQSVTGRVDVVNR